MAGPKDSSFPVPFTCCSRRWPMPIGRPSEAPLDLRRYPMPIRRSSEPALDPAMLEMLLASGDGAPPLDHKLEVVRALRAGMRDGGALLDRVLLEQVTRLRLGLGAAEAAQHELRALLDRLAAPPWHPAVFLRAVETELGPRAMVVQAGARRVVAIGEHVALDALAIGEEVYLGSDGSVIAGRSPYGAPAFGETAAFERM